MGKSHVVETKELPRAPTNQCASDLMAHGLDLDIARRERCGSEKEESVADFLGWEVSGGPRKEFGQRDGPGLTHMYGASRAGSCTSKVPHARKEEGGLVALTSIGGEIAAPSGDIVNRCRDGKLGVIYKNTLN